MKMADTIGIGRGHGLFAILGIVAAILIFTNLGRDYLWEDEGERRRSP